MPISISKAVEILTQMSEGTDVSSLEDRIEALKLGYAALERIKRMRHYPGMPFTNPLTGETED